MKLFFPILLILISVVPVFGQITVNNGSTLIIESGTTLSTGSLSDSIIISSNGLIINDGVINLDSTGYIHETNLPVIGSGHEIIALNEVSSFSNSNFGGLGLELTYNDTLEELYIKRFHTSLNILSSQSIERWYEIGSKDTVVLDLGIHYHDSELNGLSEQSLLLISSKDSGQTWQYDLGQNNMVNNEVFNLQSNIYGWFSLADSVIFTSINYIFNAPNVYPNPIQAGNFITIEYQADEYMIQLTDISGRLISSSDGNGSIKFIIPENVKKGIYLLAIITDKQRFSKKIFVE